MTHDPGASPYGPPGSGQGGVVEAFPTLRVGFPAVDAGRARHWPQLLLAGVLIAVLVYTLNVAFWMDRKVLDHDAFAASVTTGLQSEPSRQVIGRKAMDELIERIPLLVIVEDAGASAIASLLEAEVFEVTFFTVADDIHRRLVTGDPTATVIALVGMKDLLLTISPTLAEQVPEGFFDAVEVIEEGAIPSLAWADRMAPYAWPLALVLLAAVVTVLLAAGRAGIGEALISVGGGVVAGAAVSLLSWPLGRLYILARTTTETSETVALEAYRVLGSSFLLQTTVVLLVGAAVLFAGAVISLTGRPRVTAG